MITKDLLKAFYKQYEIEPIDLPKMEYWGFYEVIGEKCYPKLTPEIFIKILNVLWKEQIDMNVDNDCDLEQLINYRGQTYQNRVIQWLVDAGIYLDTDVYNHIDYEIKQLLKG